MKSTEKIKYTEKFGSFSTMGFYPIKDQVLVLPLNVIPMKQSDIILPGLSEAEQQKQGMLKFDKYPYQAIVAAVGPGFDTTHPTTVRPGMRVFMNQPWTEKDGSIPQGRMFLWEGINYYKCQEGNICGIADTDSDDPRLVDTKKDNLSVVN